MAGSLGQGNRGFKWIYNENTVAPSLVEMPMVAGVTYWNGNVVTVSGTSGSVRLATEADTSVFGVCAHTLSTAVAADRVLVYPFAHGNVFEVLAAAGMSGGYPPNYIGRTCDLEIPTATYHRIDTGAGTKTFQIIGYNPADKAKATQGLRYWVKGRVSKSIAADAERH
jgi:hypothetical protein